MQFYWFKSFISLLKENNSLTSSHDEYDSDSETCSNIESEFLSISSCCLYFGFPTFYNFIKLDAKKSCIKSESKL